jgi:TolB-like protein
LRSDDRALARLAESVADGAPIDWDAAESGLVAREQRLVRHLRLVDRISTVYRTLPSDPADGDTTAVAEPTGERWGPLIILEPIGAGTSCEVFRAWDTNLHRDVALKLLHDDGVREDAKQRVLDEARRLAKVEHPHVVPVYGAEEHDGRVGLWMQWVRGESLDRQLDARGPFVPAEAAQIGQAVCAAVGAVHGAGLLHRDIKAQNVVRDSSGRVVLMDFGTGEPLRASGGSNRLVGTPLYLAPEIFAGRQASVRSDLYSIGVLLFHLVTGRFPVSGESMESLAAAHERRDAQRLQQLRPDLPLRFVAVVEKALDPEPSRRFATAEEMEVALREALQEPRETVVPLLAPPAAVRRTPGWAFAAAAAILCAITLALIVWTGGGPGAAILPTRVAVLPFTVSSGLADTAALAEVLSDQLIAKLGEVDSLRVIAPASVSGFANGSKPPATIAATLGVEFLLQPKLTVEGDGQSRRVRVDANLLNGTGKSLWTRTFVREVGAIESLNAEIAREVASTVRASINSASSRRLAANRETSQAVVEAYYQGLHHLKQLSTDHTRLALASFDRAIELDPKYSPALAAMGRGYVLLGFQGAVSNSEARARARVYVQRALQLDPESSEAQTVSADLKFYYDWDWIGADEAYRRAIASNVSSERALTQYARYLSAAGRLQTAVEFAQRAVEVSPRSSSAASTLALAYLFARDYPAALRAIDTAEELDPSSAGVQIIRSRILAASGAIGEASRAAREAVTRSRVPPPGWRAHLITLQAQSGDQPGARIAAEKLSAELAVDKARMNAEHFAYIYLALSEPARALDFLEQAIDDHSVEALWLAVDPRVDALRGDARFERVLARLSGR